MKKLWFIPFAFVVSCCALAQSYPNKPIRIYVPFPAGGGTDIAAREVAGKMTATKGWNFIIDNKPGSGGNLGVDAAAKSPADGYSLVMGQTSNIAINPTLFAKMPYDSVADLSPVGLVGNSAVAIVVNANSPLKTFADLTNAAKAKPSTVNFGSAGNGTVGHLTIEMLQREANVKFTHVPYRGGAQAITDLIGGQIDVYISSIPTLIGHIKSGKMRALAVTSLKRSDDLPQVPTVSESGFKGFESVTWFGLLAPAKTPASVVNLLNLEINKALSAPDLKKKLEDQGLELTPKTPEQFAQIIKDDIAKWGAIVKASGAKAD
jgi:tripartite-type tricarboxylate transporter receptor subunit TctC